MHLRLISFPRCEKTALQGGLFRNTYDFAVGKSFHDSSYRKSTSSIPALCLESRCFGQSDAHQPPTKGCSKGGRVKALIRTQRKLDNTAPCSC